MGSFVWFFWLSKPGPHMGFPGPSPVPLLWALHHKGEVRVRAAEVPPAAAYPWPSFLGSRELCPSVHTERPGGFRGSHPEWQN